MKKQILKGIALVLALAATLPLASCGGGNTGDVTEDGKIILTIGDWPTESRPEAYANFEEKKAAFEAMYPEYVIKPDNYVFNIKTYVMKVTGKTVPDILSIPFTEVTKVIENKYVADVSDALTKIGWMEYVNPEIKDLITKGDNMYAIPHTAYLRGFGVNKKLFVEAGLVNADGSVKTPKTWDEVKEYAKIVKEKTGKAGFIIPTTENCGGWDMLNIAWSFGVDFMEETSDGKYKATFDTQEMRDAFQWLYDMKWVDNSLPENTVINNAERFKIFGIYDGAMTFMNAPGQDCVRKYNMDKNDVIITTVPAGPEGQYTQLGGAVYVFSKDATPEQIEGCLKWMQFTGYGPRDLSEEELKVYEESQKMAIADGQLMMTKDALSLWTYEDPKKNEIRAKYANAPMENYAEYFENRGTARPEEPVACQELYSVIDGCIQEILTNKDVDIAALVTQANNDFQVNYLDKL